MNIAIVIGASSGIGLEVARLLKQKGWTVGVAARREERLKEFEHTAQIDVNSDKAGEQLLELVQKTGGMDLYFHASGIGHQNRDLDENIELQTVNTNGLGFARMVGTAYRYMAAHGGGHIAVISSIAGTKGLGPAPAYSATKAFQNTYIQSLEQLANARHLNIRFTDLRPGFVATDLLNDGNRYPMLLDKSSVASDIVRSIEKKRHVRIIDWRWRAITCLWKRIPRWLWRRMVLAMLMLASAVPQNSWGQQPMLAWGDQGNGTYINPILNADYSDPDVIRVGEKYYMVASDFHFVGMQILESDDMVNWRILTQVYRRFAIASQTPSDAQGNDAASMADASLAGIDLPGWNTNERYAGGSWAPAIRYHDGKFWIYFCTPHEGLFMTQADQPEGPWSPLWCVKAVEKWEDPCPFWDDDGNAYLGRSRHGAGPIIVHRMSNDGRQLLDEGVTVYTGPVAEGTKFLKRNGYYYISIPEGGVGTGWQTILRAKNIYGPYEKRVVLEQGTTAVNGPHQGAIVDTPEGQWWFYHFQHNGALGRVVHLQPMHWSDDWPVIGVDIDRNGIGEPVAAWIMPLVVAGSNAEEKTTHQTARQSHISTVFTFNSADLHPAWQWNHNPANEAWSLTEHKGLLTLHALQAADFRHARNTLTQRVTGYKSEATICIDCSHMDEGGRAGLVCMGKTNRELGIVSKGGKRMMYVGNGDADCSALQPAIYSNGKVWLRISFDMIDRQYRFSYSKDGRKFTDAGQPFFVDFGNWKGVRFGIFHYNNLADAGYITVKEVRYDYEK